MGKYIDAEKLKERIIKLESESCISEEVDGFDDGIGCVLNVIDSLQQEQQEVDLDALVNEAFDKYSSVDGYGQLAVSFNRAELYSFIKEIARKEETK